MASEGSFEYIVVGAGAAGSVISDRLSKAGATVLLLEAGGSDTTPAIHEMGGFVSLWGSDVDWQLPTSEQPGLGGRSLVINQGKVLGGSTSINAMMYVRGNRRNFDLWNALGADDWNYDKVLPVFKSLEDYQGTPSEFHGVGGPIPVRDCPDMVMRSEAFMNACVEAGFDGPYWDSNGARQENGAGLLQFHIDAQDKRASAATVFLAPARRRENFSLCTGSMVTRILFRSQRAVGVEYIQGGQRNTAQASKEVIICAGAFFSPKLLLQSGIGPANELKAFASADTPLVVDSPGVGKNLQDHMQLPVVFQTKVNIPNTTLLTGNVLFVQTRTGGPEAAPDLQLNFTPSVPAPLAPILNIPVPACIFLPILVQPFSKGEVCLRSSDPLEAPVINPGYLNQKADLKVFVEAVRLIREIANTSAFADMNSAELVPGPGADLEGFIRSQSSTLWHPAGTCKMGQDAMAVVDPQLRVYGVDGLRVADASIMPTVTSGNTVATCFMIGARAANIILGEE
ncbi:MAG: GMC family oxidoreductase N-terminal domain-containing protein [Anaerolineaceae bacterium]|nr:GMC family oxidoreductase N-terminal domain-containing protein [Anaerolineaceae bacterium]